jgi:hypothetical protein
VVRALVVGSTARWDCLCAAAWGCSAYWRVLSEDVPEWEGEYVWGGRDMGRGRGTVPRGMGAVVDIVGVFGGRPSSSGRSSNAGEGGTW